MSVSKESPVVEKRTSSDFSIVSILTSTLKKASVIGIVYLAGYMQWSVAWFIGPLILSVIREQWKKSSDRRRTASKTAALSDEKDVVLARLNDLPAWVFFPDIERAEWLNRIIKQLWPSVNLYAKQIVRDTIQPALKESLEKYKLSGFRFERIILGTVPFRIGGVKVYDKNIDRNEIVMDLDIFYAGDCDITFYLSGMKGGIRDFQLHGMLRVVMKPLITSVPLVGGLQVFFLNNPDIDFDLVGIADVLDMPGLSDILRRIVVETVANMMVLPNKFPIQLSEEVEAIELKSPEPEGVLRVHVLEAKHLMKKDISMLGKGKSDPYAVITVGAQTFKTKVIDNTVDPKWDYWCEFNILETNGQQLYIHLWDKDDTGDDESLGRATVEISNIVAKGSENTWVTLEQAKHGMVHLRFTWLTLSKDYSDLNRVLAETQMLQVSTLNTAIITVFVDSAKSLPLHGMLRVVMKPLITSVPLVGGLQVFFLNNPDIDFDLVGIADVLDMPGLSDILRRIVVETVANMMVLPNKFPIQLSEEVEAIELKSPEPEGVLRVHVLEAKHLMKKDISMLGKGKSDPYAVITVGAQTFKTKVIDNTVDPKWDYWCEFNILETNGQQLYIHLWDKDDTGDDESLGRATVEISNIVAKGSENTWVTLEQAKHGMVHLRFTWLTLSKDYSDLNRVLAETQILQVSTLNTAIITVFVDSAKSLPQARASTKPDPYATLRVGSTTKETEHKMRNIHPVWEQGFTFLVANPENDTLYLSIIDKKTNSEIGQLKYKIKNLSDKFNLEIRKQPFSLLKSGPESKIVLSMHLRILKARPEEEQMQGDQPHVLERTGSTVSTSSTGSKQLLINAIDDNPLLKKQSSVQETVEDIIEDSSRSSLSSVPGLNPEEQLIHRTTSITSSAGEAGLGRIQLTLRYSVQRQRLIVVVHKVANIPLKDPSDIPDPYVKLYLLPERAKDSKRKTQVIKDNCNPVFDETFEYVTNQAELSNKQLEVTVCTQKQLFYSSSNVLGQVIIDLESLNLAQAYNAWFDLQPEGRE